MSVLANLLFRADITVLGGVPHAAVARVVVDSREAVPGALFCAVRGTVRDGNAFADQAMLALVVVEVVGSQFRNMNQPLDEHIVERDEKTERHDGRHTALEFLADMILHEITLEPVLHVTTGFVGTPLRGRTMQADV